MRVHLYKLDRDRRQEIRVECDRRKSGIFLLIATVGWFLYGAWLFRDVLFRKVENTPHWPAFAIWALAGIALVISLMWVAFGWRAATFVADELRVRSFIGPFRVRTRNYATTNIRDIRLWCQGVNDGRWKTTSRSIVFDYCGRMVILFPYLPEHAADRLLRDMHRHAWPTALDNIMRPLVLVLCFQVLASVALARDETPTESIPNEIVLLWDLSLDADGAIIGLDPTGDFDYPDVRKQIEPIVRRWRFTPGRLDGRPLPTGTTLYVTLTVDHVGAADAYKIHVASASTGSRCVQRNLARYPEPALQALRHGGVWIRADYDGDGQVVSVSVMDSTMPGIDKSLKQAALDAAKRWIFRPETVGGHGVAETFAIATCFSITETNERCYQKVRGNTEIMDRSKAGPMTSVATVDTSATR